MIHDIQKYLKLPVITLQHSHLHDDYWNLRGIIIGYRFSLSNHEENENEFEEVFLIYFDIDENQKNRFGQLIKHRCCTSLWLSLDMFQFKS